MIMVFCHGIEVNENIGVGVLVKKGGVNREFFIPVGPSEGVDAEIIAIQKAIELVEKEQTSVVFISYSAFMIDKKLVASHYKKDNEMIDEIIKKLMLFNHSQVWNAKGPLFHEEMERVYYLANQSVLLIKSTMHFDSKQNLNT